MKQHDRIFAFLAAAAVSCGMILQCTVSAFAVQKPQVSISETEPEPDPSSEVKAPVSRSLPPILTVRKPAGGAGFSVQAIDLHEDGSYTICPDEEQDITAIPVIGGVIADDSEKGYKLIPRPMHYYLDNLSKAYLVSFPDKLDTEMSLSYNNHLFSLESTNTDQVIFDLNGSIRFIGAESDYNLKILADTGYSPTDWTYVELEGTCSSFTGSFAEKGYHFAADNLKDITVSATGENTLAACRFSSESKKAFIYEIAEDQIGVFVDQDDDGICELPCSVTPAYHYRLGEVDIYPGITVSDAQYTLIAYADMLAGNECTLNFKANADINGDKQITAEDAQLIMLYYVNNSVSGIPTTWEDLLGKKS